MYQTCFSRTLLLTIWLTSSCECDRCVQTVGDRDSPHRGGNIVSGTRPHHTDELDERKAHGNNHRVVEVGDRTHNLIVAREEVFDQTCFVIRSPSNT